MQITTLYTIGFTKKSAEDFFNKLKKQGVKLLIDVRLNNSSQLAGFAKKNDLIYFLKELCNCKYIHEPLLAPTKDILDNYKKKQISWDTYKSEFEKLIANRRIEDQYKSQLLNFSCLLCSEDDPAKCHRKLVAEYLQKKLENIEIVHL